MRTASAMDSHGLRDVSGARQRSGGVEKYSSIASRLSALAIAKVPGGGRS